MLQTSPYYYPLLIFLLIFFDSLLIIIYLNTSLLSVLLEKVPWLKKFGNYNVVFSYYTKKELANVLLLSAMRYVVFTTQFFVLLRIFQVQITYPEAIILTMVMLFMISVIPTIALTEISVRGSVAIFLFSLVTVNISGVLSATFMLWIINLLVPALIGSVFVFTLKFFRK